MNQNRERIKNGFIEQHVTMMLNPLLQVSPFAPAPVASYFSSAGAPRKSWHARRN
jgi:hypothetical protein